jgi:hypothetical protein
MMLDPDEPQADGAPPLPPRPAADVLVPRLRPAQLRRELRRLEAERESALRELGGLVVEMSRRGALVPSLLADRAAGVRSLQRQIDAVAAALDGRSPA